jgi:hypothetical protein
MNLDENIPALERKAHREIATLKLGLQLGPMLLH